MEYKTETSQGQATEVLIDRLSNIPDQIAHHILSFLQIKDLSCFGCVSKKCHQIFLSTPTINFDGFSSELLESYNERLCLWSYLDRYLFRRGVNRIERFNFHWKLHYDGQKVELHSDEKFRLNKWICNAINCNVEVLDIKIKGWDRDPLRLPPCVLLGASLKSVSVSLHYYSFKAPPLTSFSNLECLKLKGVKLEDEGLFKWISCACKCIKELSLKEIFVAESVTVTIESSSLECIELDCCTHHLYITGEKLRKIFLNILGISSKLLNICAPNLNSLTWVGSMLKPNLGRLECLEEAYIDLLPSDDEFVYVAEVFSCLSTAKVLTLDNWTMMALFKGGCMPLLKNVFQLCILIEGFVDILVPAMTSLLGGMSKLNTLIIKSDSVFREPKADCCGFNMGYWKLQNSAFTNQLKEFTIELSQGSNGFEFSRYILDHAKNLKKMTLVHSPQQSNAMSKLKKSKMASNITIDFQEDEKRGPPMRKRKKAV